MPYIGSSASPLPVNFAAVQAQSFNGTGSQTAFTLSRTVPSAASIEVLVNNVQQSPYDASYSVSGTTLTFSEAPSSGTNNVYVVYRDQSLGSLVDESAYRKAEAVAKAGDTMTGNLGIGATPSTKLTIGRVDSSNEGGQIDLCRASDNTSAWAIDVFGNTSTPSLRFVDNVAALTRMQIDGAGRVTMPYQPAFMAVRLANHVTSSGVIVFENVRHNVGGHYNSSNGRFTAPVSGVYVFGMTCLLYNMGNSSNVTLNVNGSSFDGHGFFGVYGQFSGSYAGQGATLSVRLNAGDYVEFYYSNNGTHLHNGYTKAFGHLLG